MNRLWLTGCTLLFIHFVQAQQRGTGLLLDNNSFRESKVLPTYTGEKFTNIPLRVSLRKQCPYADDQGTAASTCVGWAVGYGALTIERAIQRGMTDRDSITDMAHSALYLYNRTKSPQKRDCSESLLPKNALEILKKEGDCLNSTFNSTITNCAKQPDAKAQAEAQRYRIKDYAGVFTLDDKPDDRVMKTKQMLAAQHPLVACVNITKSFYNLNSLTEWKPDATNDPVLGESPKVGHAMVIVGYDDTRKVFELMNSWGREWGNRGFVDISYTTFKQYVQYAYVLSINDNTALKAGSAMQSEIQLAGDFVFNYMDDDKGLIESKANFNASKGYYELDRKDWKVGQVFQLLSRNVPRGKYVYVFSQDPTEKITIHYPLSTNDFSNFMPCETAEIAIPNPDSGLELSQVGTDNLCILYADKAIEDFSRRLDKMPVVKGSFSDKLKTAFGDVLVNDKLIRYDLNTMHFVSRSKIGEGSVVPLVLTVEARN